MSRRITIAMVLMVLGTLLVSGAVSLGLAARSTTIETQKELVREAQGLATSVPQEAATISKTDPARALRTVLAALRASLRLDGSAVLGVTTNASGPVLFNPTPPVALNPPLPSGLTVADLDPAALLRGQTVSGHKSGGLVYAAVPYQASLLIRNTPRDVTQVVILTRRPPSALKSAGPWFLLSAMVILVVAALVARSLGRRFVRPIQAAQEVTSRIAAGDLEARVPNPPGADPELAALASSINAMAEGLAQARGAERVFLQSVSHDLRTPLTSIRGFAEAIEDGATSDAVTAAGVIATEARRLERLVADLLSLATLDARRFTLQLQPIDLTGAVAEAAAGFGPKAAELGLSVAVDGSTSVTAFADRDRLGQVAANLMENALRFATHDVHVGVGLRGTEAAMWVQDDGPGISPDDLARVFERLYVSRPPHGRAIGTGLGLAIVAELVAAMGGRVWAESPVGPGGGTRMVVALPGARASLPTGNR